MKAANHAPHNHDRRNSNNPHHSHSHGHSHHHDSTHTNQHSIHHNPHQPLKITSTWNRILDKLELSIEQQNLCNKPTKIYVYNKKSKSSKNPKAKTIRVVQGCIQLLSLNKNKVTFSIPMPQLQSIYYGHEHDFWKSRISLVLKVV